MISFLTLVPLSLCTINAKSKRLVAGLHSLSPLLVHCFSVRFCPCNRVPSFWRENLCLEPSVSKRDTCLSLSVETFSLRLSLQSCLASDQFQRFLILLERQLCYKQSLGFKLTSTVVLIHEKIHTNI